MKIRDIIAAQLMSGKVNDFYAPAYRKNMAEKGEPDNWVLISAKEATNEKIETAAKNAYKIADVMLRISEK